MTQDQWEKVLRCAAVISGADSFSSEYMDALRDLCEPSDEAAIESDLTALDAEEKAAEIVVLQARLAELTQ